MLHLMLEPILDPVYSMVDWLRLHYLFGQLITIPQI